MTLFLTVAGNGWNSGIDHDQHCFSDWNYISLKRSLGIGVRSLRFLLPKGIDSYPMGGGGVGGVSRSEGPTPEIRKSEGPRIFKGIVGIQ